MPDDEYFAMMEDSLDWVLDDDGELSFLGDVDYSPREFVEGPSGWEEIGWMPEREHTPVTDARLIAVLNSKKAFLRPA